MKNNATSSDDQDQCEAKKDIDMKPRRTRKDRKDRNSRAVSPVRFNYPKTHKMMQIGDEKNEESNIYNRLIARQNQMNEMDDDEVIPVKKSHFKLSRNFQTNQDDSSGKDSTQDSLNIVSP